MGLAIGDEMRLLLAIVVLAGGLCAPPPPSSAPTAPVAPAAPVEPAPAASKAPCATRTRSTLPGVTITFPDQPCALTLSQARDSTFRWQIVVSEPTGPLLHRAQRSCARLGAGGFAAEATLGGGPYTYCLCDVGLCPPSELRSAPQPGIYSDAMPWDGRAWFGPSDFNNPKGDAFPPGTYPLTVRLAGTREGVPWEVVGELDVAILPEGSMEPPSPPATAPQPRPKKPHPTPIPVDPDPPFPRPDLDAPQARACTTAADCVVSCAMSCCGAPCGCRSALNRETAAKAEAWGTRGCPTPRDCPAMGCAYQPAFGATCREGRCEVLRSLSDY